LDWDILAEVPGMKAWNKGMRDSDIARTIETDGHANEPKFSAYITDYMASNTIPGK
jgi:glutathione S-transferase